MSHQAEQILGWATSFVTGALPDANMGQMIDVARILKAVARAVLHEDDRGAWREAADLITNSLHSGIDLDTKGKAQLLELQAAVMARLAG